MSILIPTVGKIRTKAYQVRTLGMIQKISAACQHYFADFQAYPGIIDDGQLFPILQSAPVDRTSGKQMHNVSQSPDPTDDVSFVTSSENLVLSLLGGASVVSNGGPASSFAFDRKLTRGGGVQSLNPLNPKGYNAYIDYNANELSEGQFYNADRDRPPVGKDSVIPEFVDAFPNPMPIIYIRAQPGSTVVSSNGLGAQYCEQFLQPYWRQAAPPTTPGGDYTALPPFPTYDKPGASNQQVVYNSARDVFASPSVANQARGKDTFILIAAGASRQYGTRDMIFSGD